MDQAVKPIAGCAVQDVQDDEVRNSNLEMWNKVITAHVGLLGRLIYFYVQHTVFSAAVFSHITLTLYTINDIHHTPNIYIGNVTCL